MKNIDFYIAKTIRYLTPVILFLPLYINSGFYFPFITPRTFAFRIIVSIILALYLFLFVRNRKKYKPIWSSIVVAYLALALIMTLASILGGDWQYSFWSDYERMEGLLNLYYLVAYFMVILGVYYRKKAWHQLLYISTFVSFIITFIALSQVLKIDLLLTSAGGERVSSTTGNPTYLAAYAMFHIFFALYLIFKDKRVKLKFELIGFYVLDILFIFSEIKASQLGNPGILSRIFGHFTMLILFVVPQILLHLNCYWRSMKSELIRYSRLAYYCLIILLNFLALFHTQTRGALLGLFLGVIIGSLFMLFAGRVDKKIKIGALALILLVVAFVASAFVFKNTDLVKDHKSFRRLSDVSLSDTTAQTRLLTWQLSLKGWQEKPILGWGEEQFSVVFNKYFPAAIFKSAGSTVWFDRPHNIFLQYLVNGGILGFLAYISIFILVLIRLLKYYHRSHDAKTVAILGALLIGYGVQDFFVFDSLNTYILFIPYLAIVTFITTQKKGEKTVVTPIQQSSGGRVWLAPAALLSTLIIGYILNVPQLATNLNFVKQYTKIKSAGTFGEAESQIFFAIINKHYLGKLESRQVYADYAAQLDENKNASLLQKIQVTTLAETEMLKSISEQPNNVRHHAFLINLYLTAAEKVDKSYADKNIELINRSLPLSPTRTPFYYSLGRSYMVKGDIEEAIKQFEKARDISPNVIESHINILATYLVANKNDEAKNLIKTLEESEAFRAKGGQYLKSYLYSRLAEVYYAFRQPDEAIVLLERAAVHYPIDTQLISQLIVYYYQSNKKDKVDFYIDKLGQIDPALAREARSLVSQTSTTPVQPSQP